MLSNRQIQAILKEDRASRREPYPTDVFHPEWYHFLGIEDICDLSLFFNPINLQFMRSPKFRRWDGKTYYDKIEGALGTHLENMVFCGFYIARHGLIVEFLRSTNRKLIQAAEKTKTRIDRAGWEHTAQAIRKEEQQRLYDEFSVKIAVKGDAQAAFVHKQSDDAIIVSHNRSSTLAAIIKNSHQTETIVLKHDHDKPNYRIIYS